jgi:DNA-binding MarR family transcriptional regulator
MSNIYDAKNFDPSNAIGFLVNRVRTELLDAIDKELAPLEVTAAQYIIMGHLVHKYMAGSTSQLCKGISYDPGAMTRMIDRLETKGFIKRTRCPEDRRAVNLELTAEGKAVFPKMRARVVGVLNRLLHGFTRDEARQLESFLQRILANA